MIWTLAQAADAAKTSSDKIDHALSAAGTTVTQAIHGDQEAISALLVQYLLPLVWAIIIILVTFLVAKMISSTVRRAASKSRVDATLSAFFGKTVFYVVVLIGAMFAMSKFGIEVTSFAAILAAAGFAVGMAMAGTLSNFAAGVMLLVFRPFKVGDVVNVADVTAKVNEIELFTTTLDTFDNRRIIVPNAQIYGGKIENVSFHQQRRVDVHVNVVHTADVDKTRQALTQAVETLKDKLIEGEGRGSAVVLWDLDNGAAHWVLRFWSNAADYWTVREQLTLAVKIQLGQAGIGIPRTQMDVHLDKSE